MRQYTHGAVDAYSGHDENTYRIVDDKTVEIDLRRRDGEIAAVVFISPGSLPVVIKHSWCLDTLGYAVARIGGKLVRLHRFLLPVGNLYVDHRNRDKLDDRLENLRICTPGQNSRNQAGHLGTSHYKGVSMAKRASGTYWAVYAKFPKSPKRFHGYYQTELGAAYAYNAAAKKYGDEFTYLNDLAD